MDYDVIVVGGGTAGLAAYRKAKSLNKKVIIIEKRDFVTTCAEVGCMPSKLLIAASENLHEVNKSHLFGINTSYKIDDKKLLNRVRRERDRFVGFVKKGAANIPEEDKIIGEVVFKDKHTIDIRTNEGLQTLSSKVFVLAVGTRPHIAPIFNQIKKYIYTNENIFEIEKLPKRVAVFGAGVIGLELGFAFKNLGAEVVLFNRQDKILKLDEDINAEVLSHIKNSFDFIHEYTVEHVEKKDNTFEIYYGDKSVDVELILSATGRVSNIDRLNLTDIYGLSHSELLLEYNAQTTQLGDTNLFLAGDVSEQLPVLHEAAIEGNIAGENASTYPEIKEFRRKEEISVVFSSPQIMWVGRKQPNCDYIVGEVSFEDQGRSRVMLKNQGRLKLFYDSETQLLKHAQMFGPSAEHLAHALVWLIEKETTLEDMLNFPYYHPVIEEGLRTAVRDAYKKWQEK